MLDEELREQLHDWLRSADPLPVPAIANLRHRNRRRRLVVAGLAAGFLAAGTAIGVGLPVLTAGLSHSAPRPATSQHRHHGKAQPRTYPAGWYPAGPLPPPDADLDAAPYFVLVNIRQAPADALVVDSQTGRTTAAVQPPASGGGYGFTAVAAAGDDRTFILAASNESDVLTEFYELRLRSDGRPASVTRLPLSWLGLGAPQQQSFAISPNGRELAVVTGPAPNAIRVISLATGTSRIWKSHQLGQASELAFAGNDHLAFDWNPAAPGRTGPGPGAGLWLLDIHGGGVNLLTQSRRLLPASATFGGFGFDESSGSPSLASADGSTIFVLMTKAEQVNGLHEIVQVSVRAGLPVRAELPATGVGMGTPWCGPLWTDPSGRRLAAMCGALGNTGQGVVSDGQLAERDLHDSNPAFTAW